MLDLRRSGDMGGGATIIARVDKDGDQKLELLEVRAAAGRRYDLIKSKNGGHVTMLQLGGRLVPKDLRAVGGTPGVAATVSNEEYLGLVGKFFDEADARASGGAMEDNIRQALTSPDDFEALKPDDSTRAGLSEQVLAAMARATLTKCVAGVTFNEITAHRDEVGQLTRIEVDFLDQVHHPSPRSVTVLFE